MTEATHKLSAHFTVRECSKSEIATRLDLNNHPPDDVIENMENLCVHVLEPIRAAFGAFSPNSVYRSSEVNKAVGGKPTSSHCRGEAADVEIAEIDNLSLAHWCTNNLDDWDQIILEFYTNGVRNSGWCHIGLKLADNRKQILTISKSGTMIGLPSLSK